MKLPAPTSPPSPVYRDPWLATIEAARAWRKARIAVMKNEGSWERLAKAEADLSHAALAAERMPRFVWGEPE